MKRIIGIILAMTLMLGTMPSAVMAAATVNWSETASGSGSDLTCFKKNNQINTAPKPDETPITGYQTFADGVSNIFGKGSDKAAKMWSGAGDWNTAYSRSDLKTMSWSLKDDKKVSAATTGKQHASVQLAAEELTFAEGGYFGFAPNATMAAVVTDGVAGDAASNGYIYPNTSTADEGVSQVGFGMVENIDGKYCINVLGYIVAADISAKVWYTIDTVFDIDTQTMDVYVNGVQKLDDVSITAKSSTSNKENTTWNFHGLHQPRLAFGSKTNGTVYFDNISLTTYTEGDAPAISEVSVYENDKGISLLDNTTIHIANTETAASDFTWEINTTETPVVYEADFSTQLADGDIMSKENYVLQVGNYFYPVICGEIAEEPKDPVVFYNLTGGKAFAGGMKAAVSPNKYDVYANGNFGKAESDDVNQFVIDREAGGTNEISYYLTAANNWSYGPETIPAAQPDANLRFGAEIAVENLDFERFGITSNGNWVSTDGGSTYAATASTRTETKQHAGLIWVENNTVSGSYELVSMGHVLVSDIQPQTYYSVMLDMDVPNQEMDAYVNGKLVLDDVSIMEKVNNSTGLFGGVGTFRMQFVSNGTSSAYLDNIYYSAYYADEDAPVIDGGITVSDYTYSDSKIVLNGATPAVSEFKANITVPTGGSIAVLDSEFAEITDEATVMDGDKYTVKYTAANGTVYFYPVIAQEYVAPAVLLNLQAGEASNKAPFVKANGEGSNNFNREAYGSYGKTDKVYALTVNYEATKAQGSNENNSVQMAVQLSDKYTTYIPEAQPNAKLHFAAQIVADELNFDIMGVSAHNSYVVKTDETTAAAHINDSATNNTASIAMYKNAEGYYDLVSFGYVLAENVQPKTIYTVDLVVDVPTQKLSAFVNGAKALDNVDLLANMTNTDVAKFIGWGQFRLVLSGKSDILNAFADNIKYTAYYNGEDIVPETGITVADYTFDNHTITLNGAAPTVDAFKAKITVPNGGSIAVLDSEYAEIADGTAVMNGERYTVKYTSADGAVYFYAVNANSKIYKRFTRFNVTNANMSNYNNREGSSFANYTGDIYGSSDAPVKLTYAVTEASTQATNDFLLKSTEGNNSLASYENTKKGHFSATIAAEELNFVQAGLRGYSKFMYHNTAGEEVVISNVLKTRHDSSPDPYFIYMRREEDGAYTLRVMGVDTGVEVLPKTFYNVDVDYDIVANTFDAYVNGIQVIDDVSIFENAKWWTQEDGNIFYDMEFYHIAQIRPYITMEVGTAATGVIYIDNIVYNDYAECDSAVTPALTVADDTQAELINGMVKRADDMATVADLKAAFNAVGEYETVTVYGADYTVLADDAVLSDWNYIAYNPLYGNTSVVPVSTSESAYVKLSEIAVDGNNYTAVLTKNPAFTQNKAYRVIIAAYDDNGMLVNVERVYGDSATIEFDASKYTNPVIKAFLWDANMDPVDEMLVK